MAFKIESLVVGPFMQNCRLIYDSQTREGIVTDPGDEASRILALCAELRLSIRAIVLTHGHIDHAAAAHSLSQSLNCKVYGPLKEDAFLIEDLTRQARFFHLPAPEELGPELNYLTAGETFEPVRGLKLEVLSTPGHTPGSVCLYCEAERFVLVGDVLFLESVGRTDFEQGSYSALESSILEKLYTLPEDTAVLTGHGPDTTIGHELDYNPYVNRNTR